MPRCNLALSAKNELPEPADQKHVEARDIREVITRSGIRHVKAFRRREERLWKLSAAGDLKGVRKAKPKDLILSWRNHTRPKFRDVIMDFSVWPFRSLQPSRWPDRPPDSDLHIRAIRREFRSHPSFPNRQLRGILSHGSPAWAECKRVTHLACAHGSAYRHHDLFVDKVDIEVAKGWGQRGFPASLELATWPARQTPSSIAFRDQATLTGARLCNDLSWPKPHEALGGFGLEPDFETDSPNDAQRAVVVVVAFATLSHFCIACAILLVAGVPIKVWKLDLVAAYKRTGQQRSTRWYRQFSTPSGTQTMDRVSFGGTDGPSVFSEQSNFARFIIVREIRYADVCYPPCDARVIAYLEARQAAFDSQDGYELALGFLMVLIDDFGGVSIADLIFRADGSARYVASGVQMNRAELHFEVALSVIKRFGHDVDPSKPDKYVPPADDMVLIGGEIDLVSETLALEPAKRLRYAKLLASTLASPTIRTSALTSLAFKMLVVCEVHPIARQWLHSSFRQLRRHHNEGVVHWEGTEAKADMIRFHDLLTSDEPLCVPLAARHSFPLDGHPDLIVKYDDASGLSKPGFEESNSPGFGAWTVRDSCLYYIVGLWSEEEAVHFSISVLEYLISLFSSITFSALFPEASHILEFTDNSGVEWSARRENATSELMQRVTARRSAALRASNIIPRTLRVSSEDNLWADKLSRQQVVEVLRHAEALGLRTQQVSVSPETRDTSWLLAPLLRDPSTRQQA